MTTRVVATSAASVPCSARLCPSRRPSVPRLPRRSPASRKTRIPVNGRRSANGNRGCGMTNSGSKCAGSVRVAYPLFQVGGGGSIPTSALQLVWGGIGFDQAMEINRRWHSVLPRFGTGAAKGCQDARFLCYAGIYDDVIYAVGIWSLPAARMLPQDGSVLELRRFVILPDAPVNTGSRGLKIMSLLVKKDRPQCRRLVSLQDMNVHNGTIYKAAGWKPTNISKGGEWSCKSRPRPKVQSDSPKQRWEKLLG